MRAADLIAVWERGQSGAVTGRAQLLVEVLGPPHPALTVGQRDALLMDLRGELFGTAVAAFACCPGCGEKLEFDFDLGDVRTAPPADPSAPLAVVHDGYLVRARPPTVGDLAAAERDPATAREALLARCVLDARRDGERISAGDLPAEVVARLGERLAEADPQAEVRLALSCPECDRSWSTAFDIVTFLWHELDTWARRLLGEVHALASAYGWAEADILAMSPLRRSLYLRMARP